MTKESSEPLFTLRTCNPRSAPALVRLAAALLSAWVASAAVEANDGLGVAKSLDGADSAEPVKEASSTPPFGFKALEIFKVEANSLGLRAADMNGDGLLDLILADNSEGTIRLLLQRRDGDDDEGDREDASAEDSINEVPSDRRFRDEKFYTEKLVSSLEVGDFNGDGKPDLAYYSDPPELEVVFQEGNWGSERKKFPIRDGSRAVNALTAGDLNEDGHLDLVLLGKSKTYLIYQREGGELARPVALYNSSDDSASIHIADVNADGRVDLLYVLPPNENSASVRLQRLEGFGPEVSFRLHPIRSWDVGTFALGHGSETASTLFTVQNSNSRLKLFRWHELPAPAGLTVPHLIALRSASGNAKRHRLLADANGDGRVELIVSYPDTAQIEVHFQDEGGDLSRKVTYPTLADANGLAAADIDGDGTLEILVTSSKEKALGVSRWKDGRLQIPETWPLPAEPVLLAVGTLGNASGERASAAGEAPVPSPTERQENDIAVERSAASSGPATDVFLVSKATPRGYELSVSAIKDGELRVLSRQQLPFKGAAPSAMRILDTDGDGVAEVLMTVPYEAAYLFRQGPRDPKPRSGPAKNKGEGKDSSHLIAFTDISRQPGFGLGQLSKLEPVALTVSRLELGPREAGGSGLPAKNRAAGLLVSSGKFVRLLGLEDSTRLKVLEQFSGRAEASKLASALMINLDEDPENEVVLLDEASNSLEILQRQTDGTYEFSDDVKVPKFDLLGLEARDMDTDGKEDLVILGKGKIGILYRRDVQPGFKEVVTYSVKKDKKLGKPHDLCLGDLNGDGIHDVILNTAPRYQLLFLTVTPPREGESSDKPPGLVQRLAFPIFEQKNYMRNNTNLGPRQMLTADVDGDGLEDLLLLIHDRILLYLQDADR